MAQEYKLWDKKFSKKEIQSQRDLYIKDIEYDCTYWPFDYTQPTHEVVKHAVYEASDAKEWQLFRVSLKGVSTNTKINMLINYWNMNQNELTIIRIWNYIGALRRGGQLNKELEVLK